jgi:hypothetical protein
MVQTEKNNNASTTVKALLCCKNRKKARRAKFLMGGSQYFTNWGESFNDFSSRVAGYAEGKFFAQGHRDFLFLKNRCNLLNPRLNDTVGQA